MIVYGKNVAKEVLSNNIKINKVIVANNFSDKELLQNLKKYNIFYMDKKIMDKKYEGNHQGIVLEIEDFKYEKLDTLYDKNFVVILDHLEDPHNLGAIVRTCEAFGVSGIIIPENRSVSVNETVMKTSVGTLYNVKISQVTNLNNTIKRLKKDGYWIYGTDMDGEDFKKVKYPDKTVVIIGNEGSGLSRIVRNSCDSIVKIPMYGKVNSLNASVATAIIVNEVINR